MPQLFLRAWNGTEKSSVSSLVRMSTDTQLPFAVCLARIRAHGWNPLVPTATGVYDGLQEAPRYFIIGNEYQGLNLLCVNWVGMHCAEKAVNGLDQ
jgi:hypothetical protein